MRKPHLYLDQVLETGTSIQLPVETAHHVARVLRMRRGQALTLFNDSGREYEAEITTIERNRVEVIVSSCHEEDRESKLDITLVQGISRGQHMDTTLQKSVELGVKRIVPVFTEFGNVRLNGGRLSRRLDHWRGLIISACEQSGRNRLVVLESAVEISDWMTTDRNPIRLILHPGNGKRLTDLQHPQAPLSILAGPEGGFSETEIALALHHDYVPVTLGPRILRTETAALACISACQALWGDLA